MRRLLTSLAAVAFTLVATPARAGDVELEAAAGATTFASTWRGDFAAGGTLRAGARFSHVVAADFQVWETYATVNHRADTGLSLGVTGYIPLRVVHPYARLFVLHQHEEALVSVVNTPLGVLFGIGPGIRHRAGGGLSLGAEIPLRSTLGSKLSWVALVNATTIYFPDATLGPAAYFGIDIGIGLDFLLQ